MTVDLHDVATHDLRELLTLLKAKTLQQPWSNGLAMARPAMVPWAAQLDGLPEVAVQAVLRAVLAEREAQREPPEMVWTGPEGAASTARDTSAVVANMLQRARKEVLLASYVFGSTKGIFQPLHDVMTAYGVRAMIFIDVTSTAEFCSVSTEAATRPDVFLGKHWPFGPPFPDLYFDPRALEPGKPPLQHAKVVVVDRRWILVGSANLTEAAMTRNVELGVMLDDPQLAAQVAEHWVAAAAGNKFRRMSGS